MSKSRKIKIGIAAGIIVILAVAMIMTKGGKKSKGGMPVGQEASVTVVRAEQPSSGDIILTTGLTGTVEPSDVVHIYAKAAGDVTAVFVKAGDMVTQGQVLFEIDTEQVETAKNSMDAASVSLSEAQSNLRRMQILYSGGDLSEQEYEQYVNAVKSAQLQYGTFFHRFHHPLAVPLSACSFQSSHSLCHVKALVLVEFPASKICAEFRKLDGAVCLEKTFRLFAADRHDGDAVDIHPVSRLTQQSDDTAGTLLRMDSRIIDGIPFAFVVDDPLLVVGAAVIFAAIAQIIYKQHAEIAYQHMIGPTGQPA